MPGDRCRTCGAAACLVWCEFCGCCLCEAHDTPTAFGHTCPECKAKVDAGVIDDTGTDLSTRRRAVVEPMLSVEACREVAARVWCDPAYQNVVMDVEACERIARILYRAANGTDAPEVEDVE